MRAAVALALAYLAATVAIIGLASCGIDLNNHSGAGKECFSLDDCGAEQICFLGACQEPGYAFQNVYVEMLPPASSGYLEQQTPGPIDLSSGSQTLALQDAVTLSGNVVGSVGTLAGTLSAVSDGSAGIPGRKLQQQTAADATSGFSLRVVPGSYVLKFAPYGTIDTLATLPPVTYAARVIAEGHAPEDLRYPPNDTLLSIHGRLRYSSSVTTGVAGALVSGTSATTTGEALTSTTSVSNQDGEYTLVFPPGAKAITVKVQPGSTQATGVASTPQNPLVPEATVAVARTSTDQARLEDVVFGMLPETVLVSPSVRSTTDEPIPNASVVFEGTIGDLRGKFVTKIDTDASGTAAVATLWPGDYRISVVPGKGQPFAVSSTWIKIEAKSTPQIVLIVGHKVKLSGTVFASDGTPVPAARLTLAPRRGPTGSGSSSTSPYALSRESTSSTDADGLFEMAVDPATVEGTAEYELTIEPERASRLPRHRELIRVGANDVVQNITLYPATFIYGRVLAPSGNAVPEVSVAFYSLDLSSSEPVLIGLGFTTTKGEFAVPLPTVAR